MVLNTKELFPDPETPVNTVSLRFGISTLTSLRLFSLAPCTRISSWLSATCDVDDACSFLAMLVDSPVLSTVAVENGQNHVYRMARSVVAFSRLRPARARSGPPGRAQAGTAGTRDSQTKPS